MRKTTIPEEFLAVAVAFGIGYLYGTAIAYMFQAGGILSIIGLEIGWPLVSIFTYRIIHDYFGDKT